MSRFPRRAATAALAAVAAGGLAMATPVSAEAASSSYVQLQICHTGAPDLDVYVVGYNQFGDWIKSYTAEVSPYGCYTFSGWWWRTNQAFELHFWVLGSKTQYWDPVFIPGDAPDGSTQMAEIYA